MFRIDIEREKHEILTDVRGRIGYGGNSGFQAINLAIQCGVSKIVLVGFDMDLDRGVHWHGLHANKLNNPPRKRLAKWRERLDAVAPAIAAMGIEVINTSELSALTAYRKSTLHEALNAC